MENAREHDLEPGDRVRFRLKPDFEAIVTDISLKMSLELFFNQKIGPRKVMISYFKQGKRKVTVVDCGELEKIPE